jgi:hypothetical protein
MIVPFCIHNYFFLSQKSSSSFFLFFSLTYHKFTKIKILLYFKISKPQERAQVRLQKHQMERKELAPEGIFQFSVSISSAAAALAASPLHENPTKRE